MKLAIIIMIILFLGAFYIVKEQQTDLKDLSSLYNFGKIYGSWISKLGKNVTALVISAYHMKWLPDINKINQENPTPNQNNSKSSNGEIDNSITIVLPD